MEKVSYNAYLEQQSINLIREISRQRFQNDAISKATDDKWQSIVENTKTKQT